jgi:hypothetical protein
MGTLTIIRANGDTHRWSNFTKGEVLDAVTHLRHEGAARRFAGMSDESGFLIASMKMLADKSSPEWRELRMLGCLVLVQQSAVPELPGQLVEHLGDYDIKVQLINLDDGKLELKIGFYPIDDSLSPIEGNHRSITLH